MIVINLSILVLNIVIQVFLLVLIATEPFLAQNTVSEFSILVSFGAPYHLEGVIMGVGGGFGCGHIDRGLSTGVTIALSYAYKANEDSLDDRA